MKRDLDLVRTILLQSEACPAGEEIRNSEVSGHDERPYEVSEHIQMLASAGFIEATISKEMSRNPKFCIIRRITWEGHEYLDSIRDPGIWEKTQQQLTKIGGSASFEIIKALAVKASMDVLEL